MARARIVTALASLAIAGSLAGCATDASTGAASPSASGAEVVRLWIEPELVDCTGVAPMQCMQVSRTEDGEPELFYDQIAGFTFVEGTSYVVDVQVTPVASPPADGSSLSYSLVEVVSEEQA